MSGAPYCPHALERLAAQPSMSVDQAYVYVARVAKDFGVTLPQARPSVQAVQSIAEERRVRDAQLDGIRGAWSAELAQYVAAVGAIRLAAVPIIDPVEKLRMVDALLERAPETPGDDTSAPALLVEMIQEGRLRAELVDHG
jgi:hypothetical protein